MKILKDAYREDFEAVLKGKKRRDSDADTKTRWIFYAWRI